MTTFALTSPEVLDDKRLREHEADFTPRPIIRQLLQHAPAVAGWNGFPSWVCDPAAGAGAWCLEMRLAWEGMTSWPGEGDFEVVALEVREEEREHLERHADEVHIGDAIEWAKAYRGKTFDVAATNPAFSLFPDYVDAFLPIAHDVWLFAPIDAMVRGEESSEWLAANAKWVRHVLVVPGGIGFRSEGGQDFRQYALWMFSSSATRDDGWSTTLLPRLPGHDRSWVTRPGTEREG
jgi:hypothetical protein